MAINFAGIENAHPCSGCGQCLTTDDLCSQCKSLSDCRSGAAQMAKWLEENRVEINSLRSQLKASQDDVKLLREAASILLGVIDAGKIMRPDCYPIVDMKAAITATAPKGEQG